MLNVVVHGRMDAMLPGMEGVTVVEADTLHWGLREKRLCRDSH
jgi:hypothetical protein